MSLWACMIRSGDDGRDPDSIAGKRSMTSVPSETWNSSLEVLLMRSKQAASEDMVAGVLGAGTRCLKLQLP